MYYLDQLLILESEQVFSAIIKIKTERANDNRTP